MSEWQAPGWPMLEDVIRTAEGRLILCSPYIRREALNAVANAFPDAVDSVEVWTKLDQRDWLLGASEPDGLRDFIDDLRIRGDSVSIRNGQHLHAKLVVSDGPKAIAGSANLTRGGYVRNLEIARLVDGDELHELRAEAERIRSNLTAVSDEQFRQFVSECMGKVETQEALLDLIRDESPTHEFTTEALLSFRELWEILEDSSTDLANDLLAIAKNVDGNNNSGKVKQAFYAVQRFLQEYPAHRQFVASLSESEWFDVHESHLWSDWSRFLNDHGDEVVENYRYSMPTLLRYLTPSAGGTRTGGGGGDNQLKRVWPFVGRAIRERQ